MEMAAHGTIVLNQSENVLRQVIEEQLAHKMWMKLDELYNKKDLPNNSFLRERFFTFKMDVSKILSENLDE